MFRLAAVFLAALLFAAAGREAPSPAILHGTRSMPTDLEVAGKIAGVEFGGVRYVSYDDLLKLPQVAYTVSDDANFSGATQISGVPLEQLASAVGAAPDADLIVALCADKYHSHYPRDYMRDHHPLLVLKINGKPPAEWPRSHMGTPLAPYLVSHPAFTPSFHVLAHADEAQIPFGVVRIEFRSQSEVFGAIRPRGDAPPESKAEEGFRIAKQNCLRCHNAGDAGGQLAGLPWIAISAWATADPANFAKYVRDPKSVNPGARMPGNPEYDDATIEALRAYFATFTADGK
jgi:mono/diheme cytochrome c family protein